MKNTHTASQTISTDVNTVYNYSIVRKFTLATLIWGILGMGMGVFIAAQLVWPELNFGLVWTTFGRLRPIHTNLVIFAFGCGA
ncbi:MAG: cbb3-type cytochrome c oxidase subunit I, partial [Nitrososphaera sp.]